MFKQYQDSDYDIYTDGRCFSHKTNKFLTPKMSAKYPTYNLTLPDGKRQIKVHRMVAEAFIPNPEDKQYVNHIDGDTHNFDVSNLEWVTASENSKHASDTGLRTKSDQTAVEYKEDLPNEYSWLPIQGYENYKISNCGRVVNSDTNRIIKQVVSNHGYLEVQLWKNNKGKTHQIHKLVYTHFNNDFNTSGYVINHIDGNKLNNNVDNLEKVTYQENNLHATYTIQTNKCNKPIEQLDLNGNVITCFPSIAEAQRQLNVSNISRAIKKNGTVGGYKWRFQV